MSPESVQVEDPNDPEVILRDLPEQERAQFLRQYHEAVDAAHEQMAAQLLAQAEDFGITSYVVREPAVPHIERVLALLNR